jgi:hypothetical protein
MGPNGHGLSCSGIDPNIDLVVEEFCIDVLSERVREALKRGDFVEVAKAFRDARSTFDQGFRIEGYRRFAPLRDEAGKTMACLQLICIKALLRRMLLGQISPEKSEEYLRELSGILTSEDVDAEMEKLEAAARARA